MTDSSGKGSTEQRDPHFFEKKRFNIAYQEEDAAFIDYQLFPQFQLHLRGPAWDPDEEAAINAVGSARVFGRYLYSPFSRILTRGVRPPLP